MEKRPQIVPYLGLPAGYCPYTNGKIWFDDDVLHDEADS
jgi:hypothetical protein